MTIEQMLICLDRNKHGSPEWNAAWQAFHASYVDRLYAQAKRLGARSEADVENCVYGAFGRILKNIKVISKGEFPAALARKQCEWAILDELKKLPRRETVTEDYHAITGTKCSLNTPKPCEALSKDECAILLGRLLNRLMELERVIVIRRINGDSFAEIADSLVHHYGVKKSDEYLRKCHERAIDKLKKWVEPNKHLFLHFLERKSS